MGVVLRRRVGNAQDGPLVVLHLFDDKLQRLERAEHVRNQFELIGHKWVSRDEFISAAITLVQLM